MAKEITLEELAKSAKVSTPVSATTTSNTNQNTSVVHTTEPTVSNRIISTEELGAQLRSANNIEPEQTLNAPLLENALSAMTKTLEERKKKIAEEFIPAITENAIEIAAEIEAGDADPEMQEITTDNSLNTNDILEDKTDVEVNYNEEYHIGDNNLDELLKDLEDDEDIHTLTEDDEDDETTEEIRARFKESLQNVKIVQNPIDISAYKIRRKPMTSSALLYGLSENNKPLKTADWPLFYTGKNVTFKECFGPELDALKKTISARNGLNGAIACLKFIYNNIIDVNKPEFEAWCKMIRTEDLESLYFGQYYACYMDSNVVARACVSDNGCKKTSLVETNIMDMVKFADDETKERFNRIRSKDTTTENIQTESTLIQISDNYVISYTTPTLYSTFIQYASLSQKIIDKYNETLNTMAYVDGIFMIDRENADLIPIEIKEYPNNINKTVKEKLTIYTKILSTLTNDQYNVLTTKLNTIVEDSKITYVYPKTECPECGADMPETPIASVLNELLFTRAQLIQVMSL